MSSNMYIKFEEPAVEGSSTAPGHEHEIEVLSWSHGFVQPTSGRRDFSVADTGEQATHQNLTFTKYLDAATNTLLRLCWSGRQIGKVTLSCYRSDGSSGKPVQYLEIVMQYVVIANYSVSGGPGDRPVENVSLDYGIVQYNYTEQKSANANAGVKPAKHNLATKTVE
jgi:type VI secretion system secreted protein Hcp